MSKDSSYQPGWGEKKEHHHHHHSYDNGHSSNHTNKWGGWMKMHDKQAYYGLMLIVVAVLGFGAYKLVMMFVNEWRAMPHDDPETEMTVDELRIHKVEEEDAISYADSLSQEYNLDSIKHHVQIDTRPVYRPPRKNTEWYITQREWKAIFKNYRIWKRMREKEKGEDEETDEGMNE
jgi:hypothetical protein